MLIPLKSSLSITTRDPSTPVRPVTIGGMASIPVPMRRLSRITLQMLPRHPRSMDRVTGWRLVMQMDGRLRRRSGCQRATVQEGSSTNARGMSHSIGFISHVINHVLLQYDTRDVTWELRPTESRSGRKRSTAHCVYELPNHKYPTLAERPRGSTALYARFSRILSSYLLISDGAGNACGLFYVSPFIPVKHAAYSFHTSQQKLHGVVRPLSLKTDVIKKRCVHQVNSVVHSQLTRMFRNRASGTPHSASRKGGASLPKLASSSSRPRSSTTNSMPSGFSASQISPTSRIGGSAAGGALSMKRQRRTSSSAQISTSPTTRKGSGGQEG